MKVPVRLIIFYFISGLINPLTAGHIKPPKRKISSETHPLLASVFSVANAVKDIVQSNKVNRFSDDNRSNLGGNPLQMLPKVLRKDDSLLGRLANKQRGDFHPRGVTDLVSPVKRVLTQGHRLLHSVGNRFSGHTTSKFIFRWPPLQTDVVPF